MRTGGGSQGVSQTEDDAGRGRGHLELFVTATHPCNYLPGRDAINLVVDPRLPLHSALYGALIEQGFRRSGSYTYRPHCIGCSACQSLRLPVDRFRPSRSQRRVLKANPEVRLVACSSLFDSRHFDLYRRYLDARHPGGGMDSPEQDDFLRFLTSPKLDTVFYELRGPDGLLGVAVTDRLPTGLSAVYTFFEPRAAALSLGVLAILLQLREARRLGLPYLYLGYWIEDCAKMRYKSQYRPSQVFRDGVWVDL